MNTKTCWKCKVVKPVSEFYRDCTKKDGLQSICKPCTKKRNREYRKKNPEYSIEWYHANKDEKEYLNPQYRYQKHRARYIERSRAYKASTRGALKTILYSASLRASKNNIAYDLDFFWLSDLWDAQDGKCLLTGIEFNTERTEKRKTFYRPYGPSLDKIDPNGGYTKDNTRLVCTAINLAMNQFGEAAFELLARAFIEHKDSKDMYS